jgi:alkylhydroperoxidase family enzyme
MRAYLLLAALTLATPAFADSSRVPLIGDDTSDPVVAKYFADVRAKGGQPLNLHRTMANAPSMMNGSGGMAYAIRYGATVPRRYREITIIRSVQLNGGHYEEMQHRPMALSCGLSKPQIDAIATWRGSKLFDPKERALLAYVEGVNAKTGPTDAAFAEMKKHFSDKEIVELTMTATNYAGTAMFTRALHTPLEPAAGDAANPYGKC